MFTILLGKLSETEDLQNIIILLGKMFLFKSKCKNTININRFKNYIKIYCKTECEMAYEAKNVLYIERWTKLKEVEGWKD